MLHQFRSGFFLNALNFLVAFALLLLFAPTVAHAGEIYSLDFNAGARKVVPRSNDVSPKVDLPDGKLQGYKFTWDSEQSPYIDMAFNKTMKLPAFSSAIVRTKVWAPVGTPVRSLNIRLKDKYGEIFQFRTNISMIKGGFFDVEWRVTPYNAEGSWGPEGKVNKKIDMPAEVVTMVVGYLPEISSGSIYMYDLTVEPFVEKGEEKVESVRPVSPPDDSSLYRKLWGVGDFSVENNALLSRTSKRNSAFTNENLKSTGTKSRRSNWFSIRNCWKGTFRSPPSFCTLTVTARFSKTIRKRFRSNRSRSSRGEVRQSSNWATLSKTRNFLSGFNASILFRAKRNRFS